MRDLRQFWGVRRLAVERVALVRLGYLRCWMACAGGEWAVAQEPVSDGTGADIAQVPFEVVPETLTWRRTAFSSAPPDFQLVPVVPDRPVQIPVAGLVQLAPQERLMLHAAFPITLEARAVLAERSVGLGILEQAHLSDTWLGTPVEGQLAYSIPVEVQIRQDQLPERQDWVRVAVEVKNDSHESLTMAKVVIRPMEVRLYSGTDYMYGGDIHIQHDASGKTSVRHTETVSLYSGTPVALPSVHRGDSGTARRLFAGAWKKLDRP
jgi:hypothetical protein